MRCQWVDDENVYYFRHKNSPRKRGFLRFLKYSEAFLIFSAFKKCPEKSKKHPRKKKKRKSWKKKLLRIVSVERDFFNAELAPKISFLNRQHWMVHPAHEKNEARVDIESAIGPKFTNAVTIICTADSRIIYPTFQRFKGRL